MVLAPVSRSYSALKGRLPTCYAPVRHSTRVPKDPFAYDLHVLSPPPAFVLSQDQTLHCKRIRSVGSQKYVSIPSHSPRMERCDRDVDKDSLCFQSHQRTVPYPLPAAHGLPRKVPGRILARTGKLRRRPSPCQSAASTLRPLQTDPDRCLMWRSLSRCARSVCGYLTQVPCHSRVSYRKNNCARF